MERGHLPIHSITSNNSNPELEEHSTIRPVPHSPELPVPIPPSNGEDYIIPD